MVEQHKNIVHVLLNLLDVAVIHLDKNGEKLAEPVGHFQKSWQTEEQAQHDENHFCYPQN